jgi:hypothetical protein
LRTVALQTAIGYSCLAPLVTQQAVQKAPAAAAIRSCVNNPLNRAFTALGHDAQSSSVVSIDAPVIHGLSPWRPLIQRFIQSATVMLIRLQVGKLSLRLSVASLSPAKIARDENVRVAVLVYHGRNVHMPVQVVGLLLGREENVRFSAGVVRTARSLPPRSL